MPRRVVITFLAFIALLAASASVSPAESAPKMFSTLAATRQASDAYMPADITTAYDVMPLYDQGISGSGQTIALVEVGAYSSSDLHQFDAGTNLPNPTVKTFYAGGKKFKLDKSTGSVAETAMDVEWAHAMAPGAAIQIYYIKNAQVSKSSWQQLGQVLDMAGANGATTVSMSFGACRPTNGYAATSQALARLFKKGVGVFVSSGDTGPFPGTRRQCGSGTGVAYPASDPSVVSVGGTSLLLSADDTISIERAWRLSGGGNGAPLSRPSWQIAATLPQDGNRWVPDVAFLADQNTGVAAFYKGNWHEVGGTSLGAPAWAGIWALVRADAQQAGKSMGAAPSIIYRIGNSASYAQAFHDIVTGSNGLYQAGPGWDAVTGWGTPDVNGLASAALSLAS